jgi:hypothetical protein
VTGSPEDGHLWQFEVRGRPSFGDAEGKHHDADWVGNPWKLEVRAWSLPEACEKAAQVPLPDWIWHHEGKDIRAGDAR